MGYRDLNVYKLAKDTDERIFDLTLQFPKSEVYNLTDQIRRSVHSIIANIAEGYGRRSYPQEYIRFLVFAQASCDESREHLQTASSRKYCPPNEFKILDDKLDHIGRMLTLLIRKIRSR